MSEHRVFLKCSIFLLIKSNLQQIDYLFSHYLGSLYALEQNWHASAISNLALIYISISYVDALKISTFHILSFWSYLLDY